MTSLLAYKFRALVLLIVFAASPAVAQSKYRDVEPSFAQMRNHNRPLIVFFASTGPNSQLQQQIKVFHEHKPELDERKVVVVLSENDAKNLRRHASRSVLRRRFGVDIGSFTVVLVGEDGEEKFRSHEPVTIEKLDALIDVMPMRQQEVRHGRHTE